MVNALLLHKDINLLHSDIRQLTAGFYAIDNKSREDGDAILRRLLEREPALVTISRCRSIRRPEIKLY
jgi:hypothetical protein